MKRPWLRYAGIATVKWIANLILVSLTLRFLIPETFRGYVNAAPIWLLSFVLAFACAEWAFRRKLPGRSDVLVLAIVWLIVSYSLDVFQVLFTFGNIYVLLSPELHVTTVLEILAIALAAFTTRRRKIEAALGEGMEE